MRQAPGTQSPLEIWQLGMDQLAKSEAEPALLGFALSTIHGALEKQFRHMLSSLPRLSQAERMRANDRKEVNWPQLRDLMQQYLGLSDANASYIMQMNSKRNQVAHEGVFHGSYQDVAAYSSFVKKWLDLTEEEWLDIAEKQWPNTNENRTPEANYSFVSRCPRCNSMNVKSLAVIYNRGVTVIERSGDTEVRRFGSSLQAAPPQKKKYWPDLGKRWWLVVAFFLSPLGTLLIMFIPFWFYHVWNFNKTKYPQLLEKWRQTFQCEQCGHTFLVRL